MLTLSHNCFVLPKTLDTDLVVGRMNGIITTPKVVKISRQNIYLQPATVACSVNYIIFDRFTQLDQQLYQHKVAIIAIDNCLLTGSLLFRPLFC